MAAEIAGHVRHRFKMEMKSKFFDGNVGCGQQAFHFHDNLPVYQFLCGRAHHPPGYFRQIVRRDAKLSGIELHLVLRMAMLHDQPAEFVEQLPGRADRMHKAARAF